VKLVCDKVREKVQREDIGHRGRIGLRGHITAGRKREAFAACGLAKKYSFFFHTASKSSWSYKSSMPYKFYISIIPSTPKLRSLYAI